MSHLGNSLSYATVRNGYTYLWIKDLVKYMYMQPLSVIMYNNTIYSKHWKETHLEKVSKFAVNLGRKCLLFNIYNILFICVIHLKECIW